MRVPFSSTNGRASCPTQTCMTQRNATPARWIRTASFVLLAVTTLGLHAQEEAHHDTTYRNTIRLNLTPLVINGLGNYVVGYERVLGPRRSFSVNTGRLALPDLIPITDSSSYQWKNVNHNRGFSFAADYRMYFTKRNRFAIPDGLYWGPFATYYYFDNNTTILLGPESAAAEAELQTNIHMVMVGVELGYQLVFHDRWTVDLILAGPAVGFYNLDMTLAADANIDPENPYVQGAYDALLGMFPGLGKLLDDDELRTNGNGSTWGGGFRYVFQVGYRF